MKIKAVVFDWDGVLCDSVELYADHYNTILQRFGKSPISIWDIRERFSGVNAKETLARAGLDKDSLDEGAEQFNSLAREGPQPKPFYDTHDMLRWLYQRSIKIYIASATPTDYLRGLIAQYELIEFVTPEVRGSLAAESKMAFINDILTALEIAPDELMFVDDMDEVLKLAEKIGCYRVGSERGYCSYERLRLSNPDEIVRNFKKLQSFINLINYREISPRPLGASPSPKKQNGSGETTTTERVFICMRLKPRSTDPFGAQQEFHENIRRAKVVARFAALRGYDPEATTLYYTQFLDDFSQYERMIGVRLGRERIALCQKMWVIDRHDGMSEGMLGDEARAEELGIPIEDHKFAIIQARINGYDKRKKESAR